MLIHLRMTGKLLLEEPSTGLSITFYFSSGKKLFFCDPRGFGKVYVQSIKKFSTSFPYKEIGIEAIKIKKKHFFSSWKEKTPVKKFLLEQKKFSGIGNIYASEILFLSKIHPLTRINQLIKKEIKEIVFWTKKILNEAIKLGGTSVVDFVSPLNEKGKYQKKLKVYNREGKECFNCKEKILKIEINSRSTFFCPKCQKEKFIN